MDDPKNLESQLLGDMTYDDPRKYQQKPAQPANLPQVDAAALLGEEEVYTPQQSAAKGALPQVDAAALLGDMSAEAPRPAQPQMHYQELTEEQVAILQQQRAAKGLPPYTPDEIAELKAEFIERQRQQAMEAAMAAQAAQQQAAAAALLAEPEDYSRPEKKPQHEALPQVDASALLEEPAPEPERKVVFNQEDLEAAKKAAAKRASESLKEVPDKTAEQQKRDREAMALLRQQQQDDLAQAGFMVSIILTVMGVIAGVCTLMFSIGAYSNPEDASGVFNFFDKCYLGAGVLLILLSITIVTRVKKLKGFTSFMFILTPIILIVPGIVLLLHQKKDAEGGGMSVACYVIAVVLCIIVTFVMSTSDKINAYYAKSDIIYD